MPPFEVTTANNEETAPPNPVVGIIYPPPEVRSILLTKIFHINNFLPTDFVGTSFQTQIFSLTV